MRKGLRGGGDGALVPHRPTKPPENSPNLETLWAMCFLYQDMVRPRRHAYLHMRGSLHCVCLDSFSIGRNLTGC